MRSPDGQPPLSRHQMGIGSTSVREGTGTDRLVQAPKSLWRSAAGWARPACPTRNGSAAPLRAHLDHAFDREDFQPSTLIFPTEGCWEVTSRVGDASLTFVTRVVKIEAAATKG